jgi:hypothetical protein
VNVDTRARAAAQAIRRSRTRLDPVAGLDELVRRRHRQPLQRAAAAGLALLVMVAAIWAGVVWGRSPSIQPTLGPSRKVAEGTVKVDLGRPLTVTLSAKEAGDEVYGTAEIISDKGGEAFSIDLECAAERNDVLILGGSVSESNTQDAKVGTSWAVLLKRGEPDRMLFYFEDPPPAGDCDAFARNIPDEVFANDNRFQPVEGDIKTG